MMMSASGFLNKGDRTLLWLSLDKDPESKAEIQALYQAAQAGDHQAQAELGDLMDHDLAFGTAGLRAAMGPGFNRMNMVTIQLATQGVAMWLEQRGAKCVVVGHDHRHQSGEFCRLTCAVLQSKGLQVLAFDQIVPTPFVPLTVEIHRADFGIMITASHNPAADNGYKVYGSNACQIMSPVDKEITAAIRQQNHQLWNVDAWLEQKASTIGLFNNITDHYIQKTRFRFQRVFEAITNNFPCPVIYTAMHGVGYETVKGLSIAFNFQVYAVPCQQDPNPDFPTCAFPNPEEGLIALQESFKFAKISHPEVRLILANDPDADRLNFAEPDSSQPGGWRIFTGNEIASLFVYFLWNHRHLLPKVTPTTSPSQFAVVSSCVSSKLIRSMAQKEGFQSIETLPGFKYIANAAQRLESKDGMIILIAYEEAIGYLVNTSVWDKDGLSALVLATLLARHCWSREIRLTDYLEEIYSRYGYFAQYNSYYFGNVNRFPDIFVNIRNKLKKSTKKEGDFARDLTGDHLIAIPGLSSATFIHSIHDYPESMMITLYLDEQQLSWLTYRASGTEPKIKFYSEMTLATRPADNVVLSRSLTECISRINEWLLEPSINGLQLKPEKN